MIDTIREKPAGDSIKTHVIGTEGFTIGGVLEQQALKSENFAN